MDIIEKDVATAEYKDKLLPSVGSRNGKYAELMRLVMVLPAGRSIVVKLSMSERNSFGATMREHFRRRRSNNSWKVLHLHRIKDGGQDDLYLVSVEEKIS